MKAIKKKFKKLRILHSIVLDYIYFKYILDNYINSIKIG